MSALTQKRVPQERSFKKLALPLDHGAGMIAYANAMACIDTATGTCKPGAAANATLIRVGTFEESYDNSAGSATVLVLVNLDRELWGRWFDNAAGGAAVTALFTQATIIDNNTVGSTGSGNGGRVWAIDPVKGVLVASTLT
jgi:hypothetical protein